MSHHEFNYFYHKWSTDGNDIVFTESDNDSDTDDGARY